MKTLFTILLFIATTVAKAQCDFPPLCDTLHLGNPVPVEIDGYSIKLVNDQPVISWYTVSEHNNAYFTVSRSDNDGVYYDVIGIIDGFGTTLEEQSYEWTDDYTKLKGQLYYQLKQIDEDGTSTLIGTLTLNLEEVTVVSGIRVQGTPESIEYYDLNGRITDASEPTIKLVVIRTNTQNYIKLIN